MRTIEQQVESFLYTTYKNVFLTGKAGTGKTTLLKKIAERSPKKMIITAPTGIAALNAGGVTLHTQFQIPPAGFIPDHTFPSTGMGLAAFENRHTLLKRMRMSNVKKSVLKTAEILVIDEVSMLRADVLDAIDCILCSIRKNKKPFGGMQLLLIGDLMQLPPVMHHQEWQILSQYYSSPYFFASKALQQNFPVYLELETIHRQTDPVFTQLLNRIRSNSLQKEDIQLLNTRCIPPVQTKSNDAVITLTTHNRLADEINVKALAQIKQATKVYCSEIEGEYPESLFPCDLNLSLKIGAQVMFLKNDQQKEARYYNGKLGVVTALFDQKIVVQTDAHQSIELEPFVWKNNRYIVDDTSKELHEETIGTFKQFPLRLAWAITIHKSQGLTFEKAILNINQVFSAGQAYVALSRIKQLSGVFLTEKFEIQNIEQEQSVLRFEQFKSKQGNTEQLLEQARVDAFKQSLIEAFNFSEITNRLKIHLHILKQQTDSQINQSLRNWALQILFAINEQIQTAQKFINQLEQYFNTQPIPLEIIRNRTLAAQNYFVSPFQQINEQVLEQIKKFETQKKSKTYVQELKEIDQWMLWSWAQVQKTQILIDAFEKNESPLKSNIDLAYRIPWRKQENIAIENIKPEVKKSKIPKGSTIETTYTMYAAGKSIQAIAEERQLALGTIEGHLAEKVKEGILTVSEFVSDEKKTAIQNLKKANPQFNWTELKNVLGSAFSFTEIRFALLEKKMETIDDHEKGN